MYITDGMLLKEYASDNLLKKYSCILLDEVHERSISNDILMWCLRRVQIERNETRRKLKLVLMSATMELQPLKSYFNAPAYYIPGRWFNVEVSSRSTLEPTISFSSSITRQLNLIKMSILIMLYTLSFNFTNRSLLSEFQTMFLDTSAVFQS